MEIIFDEEATQKLRIHHDTKEGQVIPQGDVYLHVLSGRSERAEIEADRSDLVRRIQQAGAWPDFRLGKLGEVTNELQLVQGTSRGSRHSIRQEDAGAVTIYKPAQDAHPLEGPVIVANERVDLVHPDHAPHSLPAGTYQVIHQRDWASEEARRVQD